MNIDDPQIRVTIFEIGLAARATAAGVESLQGRADCSHIAGELRLLHGLIVRAIDAADTVLATLWGGDDNPGG